MPTPDPSPPSPEDARRRRVVLLLLGILACAIVIGLCVVALVVLLNLFTAHLGDDCPASGCHSSAPER